MAEYDGPGEQGQAEYVVNGQGTQSDVVLRIAAQGCGIQQVADQVALAEYNRLFLPVGAGGEDVEGRGVRVITGWGGGAAR